MATVTACTSYEIFSDCKDFNRFTSFPVPRLHNGRLNSTVTRKMLRASSSQCNVMLGSVIRTVGYCIVRLSKTTGYAFTSLCICRTSKICVFALVEGKLIKGYLLHYLWISGKTFGIHTYRSRCKCCDLLFKLRVFP